MKLKHLLFITCLLAINYGCKSTKNVTKNEVASKTNTIQFEISPYGLIFTNLKLENNNIKSMIDFGDPNVLQLSSTLVNENNIEVKETDGIAMDIMGNRFKINTGIVDKILIGNKLERGVKFSSSPNEMESVSKQIGTEFHGVIGWGYFKKYFTTIDYTNQIFILNEEEQEIRNMTAETTFFNNDSYLIIPILIDGNNVNALIDTGSPVSLLDKGLKTETINQSIEIGGIKLQENFQKEDLSMLKDLNVKVLLGGTFLSKHKVHINPNNMKIVFE